MLGNIYKSYTDPILSLQKRGLLVIIGSAKFSHTMISFSELHIMKLEQIYYSVVQMFMYRYQINLLPDIVYDFFKLNTEVLSYNMRQYSHYHVPMCRLAHAAKNMSEINIMLYSEYIWATVLPRTLIRKQSRIYCWRKKYNFSLWLFLICPDMQGMLLTDSIVDVPIGLFIMMTSSKWKNFQRYWPYVRGIHRSPVSSPHKGQ